jgi:probable rRNA maturation factor
MSLALELQCASPGPVPAEQDLRRWIAATLEWVGRRDDAEVCVRLVGEMEMAELNRRYRGRSGPTNVLSFPSDLPPGLGLPLLGDIVVCAPLVDGEAEQQGKPRSAHWAHILVHGTLHLLGYDHLEELEAEEMEAIETAVLASLDYPCPYHDDPLREQARP